MSPEAASAQHDSAPRAPALACEGPSLPALPNPNPALVESSSEVVWRQSSVGHLSQKTADTLDVGLGYHEALLSSLPTCSADQSISTCHSVPTTLLAGVHLVGTGQWIHTSFAGRLG